MGWSAYSLDVDVSVPADKVAEALLAVNKLGAVDESDPDDNGHNYTSLAEAVDELTGFEGSEDAAGDGSDGDRFTLGWHGDKWYEDEFVAVLDALAPFVNDGAAVHMRGEDDTMFGFHVVNGEVVEVWPTVTWAPPKPPTLPASDEPQVIAIGRIEHVEYEARYTRQQVIDILAQHAGDDEPALTQLTDVELAAKLAGAAEANDLDNPVNAVLTEDTAVFDTVDTMPWHGRVISS